MVPMTVNTIIHGTTIWLNIVHPTATDVDALKERFPFIHPRYFEDTRSACDHLKGDILETSL
jgi:hypothetical protein